MTDLMRIRQACLETMRQCEQAEQTARRSVDEAMTGRNQAVGAAHASCEQSRREADSLLREIRDMRRQSTLMLNELALTPGPAPLPSPPDTNASKEQLLRLLRDKRELARSHLRKLRDAAETLKTERTKWWKLW